MFSQIKLKQTFYLIKDKTNDIRKSSFIRRIINILNSPFVKFRQGLPHLELCRIVQVYAHYSAGKNHICELFPAIAMFISIILHNRPHWLKLKNIFKLAFIYHARLVPLRTSPSSYRHSPPPPRASRTVIIFSRINNAGPLKEQLERQLTEMLFGKLFLVLVTALITLLPEIFFVLFPQKRQTIEEVKKKEKIWPGEISAKKLWLTQKNYFGHKNSRKSLWKYRKNTFLWLVPLFECISFTCALIECSWRALICKSYFWKKKVFSFYADW